VAEQCRAGDPPIRVVELARRIEALPLPSQDEEREPLVEELNTLVNGKKQCL